MEPITARLEGFGEKALWLLCTVALRMRQICKLFVSEHHALNCKSTVQAEGHWEKALGLNPLFPQGWFAMGYCCIKTRNTQRALEVTLRMQLHSS